MPRFTIFLIEIRATKTGERVTVESLGMVAEAFSFAALKRNGLGIRYFALSIPRALTMDEARRIATNIAKLPNFLTAQLLND